MPPLVAVVVDDQVLVVRGIVLLDDAAEARGRALFQPEDRQAASQGLVALGKLSTEVRRQKVDWRRHRPAGRVIGGAITVAAARVARVKVARRTTVDRLTGLDSAVAQVTAQALRSSCEGEPVHLRATCGLGSGGVGARKGTWLVVVGELAEEPLGHTVLTVV